MKYSDRKMLLALFAALAITGCGGGGGGGGGDNDDSTGGGDDNGTTTGLSSEEQVALAAFGSGGSLDAGQTGADESTDDPETASGASTQISCNDGGDHWVHEDNGGPFALDQVDFEATGVFDGNDSLSTGKDMQVRADECLNSGPGFSSRVDGITDTAQADNLGTSGEGSIGYFVGGGYDGNDPSVPSVDDRDLSTSFVSDFESDEFGDFFYSLRGEIWSCGACLDSGEAFVKDLANPNGDPQRDVGFAGRFEMGFNNFTVEAGDIDAGDVWTFVSSAGSGSNDASFVVDGRYALSDADNPECNFDVTYETSDPLYVEDLFAESRVPSEGEIKVTQNAGDDAGTTYTVNFDTGDPDTVTVNGTTYNRNDLVDDQGCSTGIETESEA